MNPDELTPPHLKHTNQDSERQSAANVLRSRLESIYAKEPSAKQEIKEVKQLVKEHETLSKHQVFMKELTDSGKDAAEIQVAWHQYYQSLSDHEKRQVWQEFYDEQAIINQQKKEQQKLAEKANLHRTLNRTHNSDLIEPTRKLTKVHKNTRRLRDNHHVRSLIFGFGMGFLVIIVLLFSFFNERFLVPFIRPNPIASTTPIIVDASTNAVVSPEPKIIIPKINLEAPVVYDVATIEEKAVQKGLENGVLHYATTPNPGEKGNAVIFGHSSGNILNKGKYKFAFILLKSLESGDTFIIHKDSKRYVYKVYNKYVTTPEDVSVLQTGDRPAMMTLITCDPPGTSSNRLIIQAEQIFPDPSANTASSVTNVVSEPKTLPSNSPSLWSRLFN